MDADSIKRALIAADKAGDVDAARKLAKALKASTSKEPAYLEKLRGDIAGYDPNKGVSGLERFAAGYGSVLPGLALGIGQRVGLTDQAAVDEHRAAVDKMSGAGTAGRVLGNVAAAVPSAAIPGANTVIGSALIGGAYGAAQPTLEDESAAQNAAAGFALGGLTQGALNLAPRAMAGLSAPFYQGGRDRLVANTLEQFATDPNAIARAASEVSPVPGVKYTLAEAAQDPGLAVLERGAVNADPAVAGQFAQARGANVEAARNAVLGIGADDAAIASMKGQRAGAVSSAYADATRQTLIGAEKDPVLQAVLKRPSTTAAIERARSMAAEKGMTLPQNIATSAQGLHYLKMAMDDLLDPRAQGGFTGAQANAVRDTRNALVDWMNTNIPRYSEGRQLYQQMSQPINRAQVGNYLYDRLAPALNDYGPAGTSSPATYARALRSGDDMVRQATGFEGATLGNTLAPDDVRQLEGVAEYFARRAGADNAGRAAGTNTAQNLATQNLVRQLFGPLGLPQSFAESTLARTITQPIGVLMKPAERRVAQDLAEALMDPKKAGDMMKRLTPGKRELLARALLERVTPTLAASSGAYAAQE